LCEKSTGGKFREYGIPPIMGLRAGKGERQIPIEVTEAIAALDATWAGEAIDATEAIVAQKH
jgi:hypothetical protein